MATTERHPQPLTDDPIRERLVEAATAVFAERGYDGARVGDIARRAGLTTGAIYSNFTGKAQLLAAAQSPLGNLPARRARVKRRVR